MNAWTPSSSLGQGKFEPDLLDMLDMLDELDHDNPPVHTEQETDAGADDNAEERMDRAIPVAISLITGNGFCAAREENGVVHLLEMRTQDQLLIEQSVAEGKVVRTPNLDNPGQLLPLFYLIPDELRVIVPFTLDPESDDDFLVVDCTDGHHESEGEAWYGLQDTIASYVDGAFTGGNSLAVQSFDPALGITIAAGTDKDGAAALKVTANRVLSGHEVWRRAQPRGGGHAIAGPRNAEMIHAAGQLAVVGFREVGAHPLDVFPSFLAAQAERTEASTDHHERALHDAASPASRLRAVSALARSLMDFHGLDHWRLDYSKKATWYAGLTRFHERTIRLSARHMMNYEYLYVRETILHEIAHALVGHEHGHNATWRRTAKRIGSNGERCVSKDAPTIDGDWAAICPNGHRYTQGRHPKRTQICRLCAGTPEARRVLTWTFRGKRLAAGVGDVVRVTGDSKWGGAVGTVAKVAQKRYHLAVDGVTGTLTVPFGMVEVVRAPQR